VDTALGPTHLTTAGAGNDVCVYLPGTNFNAATSTDVLAALGASTRIVCADLPGQPGLSAAGRPRDAVRAFRAWVQEVLAHVRAADGPGRLLLVGHSRGAAVAFGADPGSVGPSLAWLFRPTPARSRRLVVLMAGADGDHGLEHVTEWLTLTARSTRSTGAPGPLPRELLERWRDRNVAVVTGELDVFFPPGRLDQPCRHDLGQAGETVPGAGHLLTDQRPGLVAEHAARLLARA